MADPLTLTQQSLTVWWYLQNLMYYSSIGNNYANLVVFYLQLLIFTFDILQNLLRLLSGNCMIIGDRPTTLI